MGKCNEKRIFAASNRSWFSRICVPYMTPNDRSKTINQIKSQSLWEKLYSKIYVRSSAWLLP